MPVYEYECPSCARVFEVRQRISDEPLQNCPECQGKVKKLVSASSFLLKGGGWYADGYSGPTTGNGGKGGSQEKKDSGPAPSCQGGKDSCAGCPAAAA